MRIFLIGVFVVFLSVLQAVISSRFNIFPDLALVAVIIYAVLDEKEESIFFAAAAGFVQDILSVGFFVNTISKTLMAMAAGMINERFSGDKNELIVLLIALGTPLVMLVEGWSLGHFPDLTRILFTTFFNLCLVPFLLPLIRKIIYEPEP
jgi:rod shape-determining protein MreD